MKTKNFTFRKSKFVQTIIFLIVLLILNSGTAFARGKKLKEKREKKEEPKVGIISGYVVDEEFNEPLEKAVVTIPGTYISVLTDQQGQFKMKLMGSDYSIKVNCPGYYQKFYNVSVTTDIYTPMYVIKLKPTTVGREQLRKISSYENKRINPQTIENFTSWQVAEQSGHQEFNELIRAVPSANFLSNGSGFNDSEIGIRGNDATRTSYAFNGILLNNPETGKMSSGILSGLTDWAGQIQVTSGQAANLQSRTSPGGLVNVLSYAPKDQTGAEIGAIYGNEKFMKTSATVHSGLTKKGFSSSFQLSRTSGNGLVQNTGFEQYSLFAHLQKEFNQFHTLTLSLNGVIQQHDRNFADSIGAYNLYGTKYNSRWGTLAGKPFSVSTNYSRSPLISLTHYWHPRVKTNITTTVYSQFNRSAQLNLGGNPISIPLDSVSRDASGHILFDELTNWNKGLANTSLGTFRLPDANGKFINTESNGITVFSSVDSEAKLGLRTIISRIISKQTDFSASLNLEDYRANHFGTVGNLLGADGFTSYSDRNRPDGFPVENLFNYRFLTKYNTADKVNYSYLSEIQTGGISVRYNYRADRLYWYLAGSASAQNLYRTDQFNYPTSNENRKADFSLQPGGNVQTGINIQFWKYHSLHLRGSYGSYQQRFTTLFPTTDNWKNTNARNEEDLEAELGYTIFSRRLKVEALAYYAQITNRSMVRYDNLNETDAFGIINGISEIHQGVELKTSYKLTKNFQLNLNGSLGDWKYANDAMSTVYSTDKEITAKNELWLKGLRIANAPQLSLFAEAEYRWAHNFYIRLNYYRAEQNYAPFGLYDFADLADRSDYVQTNIPKYDLIGFSGNYLIQLKKSLRINLIFGGQNLLDTEYIEKSYTNFPEGDAKYTSNMVQYGMGRTWFAGVRVAF